MTEPSAAGSGVLEAHVPGEGWRALGRLSPSGWAQADTKGLRVDAVRISRTGERPVAVRSLVPWFADEPMAGLDLVRGKTDAEIGGRPQRTGVRLTARRPVEVRGELTAQARRASRSRSRSGRRSRGGADHGAGRGHGPRGHPGRGVPGTALLRGRGTHAHGPRLSAHGRSRPGTIRGLGRLLVRRRDARLPGVLGDRRRREDPLVLTRRGRRLVAAGTGPPGATRPGGAALAGRVREEVPHPGLARRPHLAHGGERRRRRGGREAVRMDNRDTRFIRVQGESRATQYGYSLWSVEAYAVAQ